MRRFFAFMMCVSGLSLAVTYTHADEPAATAIAEESQPPSETAEPQSDAAERPPTSPDPTAEARHKLDEMLGRWRQVYRQEFGEDELKPEDIKQKITQLEVLLQDSRRLAEEFTGQALEQARAAYEKKIARLEESLADAEAQSARRLEGENKQRKEAGRERPQDAAADRENDESSESASARRHVELDLAKLRAIAEQLEQSATEEADKARAAVERRIDELERYLAERRVQRDAAGRRTDGESPRPAADPRPVARLRHLRAAIEHLNAAGLREQANGLERAAAEMQAQIERDRAVQQAEARREQSERPADDNAERREVRRQEVRQHIGERREAGAFDEVRELSDEVRQMRRELRRLRAEVADLREQHAPSADGEDSEQKSPNRGPG
jgi:hypothetical protein